MTDLEKYDQSADFKKVLHAFDNGHDDVQLQYFIVGSGLTDYGKWKQACIETRTRYGALKQLGFDRLKLDAEIKILEAERDELSRNPDAVSLAKSELKTVEIAEKKSQIENVDMSATRTIREMEAMYQMALHYGKQCGEQDTFENQAALHVERLKMMAYVRTRFPEMTGPAETALLLPNKYADLVWESVDNYKALVGSRLQLEG
jgi:hypothetical protein